MKISISKSFILGGVCIILVGALLPMPSMWKAATVICGVVSVAIGKVIEE